MKINFKKWWKNYDKREEKKKKRAKRYINEQIRYYKKRGDIDFYINYSPFSEFPDYIEEYITSCGFKIYNRECFPSHNIWVRIPSRGNK